MFLIFSEHDHIVIVIWQLINEKAAFSERETIPVWWVFPIASDKVKLNFYQSSMKSKIVSQKKLRSKLSDTQQNSEFSDSRIIQLNSRDQKILHFYLSSTRYENLEEDRSNILGQRSNECFGKHCSANKRLSVRQNIRPISVPEKASYLCFRSNQIGTRIPMTRYIKTSIG